MGRIVYATATTVNGYIADENNSLAWLFAVPHTEQDLQRLAPPDAPVLVMGSTTYQWLLHEEGILESPQKWDEFYGSKSVFVLTGRSLPEPDGAAVRFRSGPVADLLPEMRSEAGDADIWVVGGGDLAGQFLDIDALDEIQLSIAPVFVTGGAALLPRSVDCTRLRLVSAEAIGAFARLIYTVEQAGR